MCLFKLSLPPAVPQTTEHLLQGLPDWLTSDRAQHPVADLLSAGAQAWQPCGPAAMKREAGGVLHLRRVLLAAAAAPSTRAGAKTACPAQGIFRAGHRQATAKKERLVNPGPGSLWPKASPWVCAQESTSGGMGTGTCYKGEGRNLHPRIRCLTRGTAADLGVPTSPCLHIAALTESMLRAIKGVSRQLELLVNSPLIPVVMALGP